MAWPVDADAQRPPLGHGALAGNQTLFPGPGPGELETWARTAQDSHPPTWSETVGTLARDQAWSPPEWGEVSPQCPGSSLSPQHRAHANTSSVCGETGEATVSRGHNVPCQQLKRGYKPGRGTKGKRRGDLSAQDHSHPFTWLKEGRVCLLSRSSENGQD